MPSSSARKRSSGSAVTGQQPSHPLGQLQRPRELAAGRLVAGLQPTLGRLVEQQQFGLPHRALAEAGDGLGGAGRLAGLQLRPDLREAQPHQRLAQAVGVAVVAVELLGLKKVVPGGLGVVLAQVPLAALDEAANHLLKQLERFLVSLRGRLAQEAVRVFQAPVLERLLRLPECQPREAEHGFCCSVRV